MSLSSPDPFEELSQVLSSGIESLQVSEKAKTTPTASTSIADASLPVSRSTSELETQISPIQTSIPSGVNLTTVVSSVATTQSVNSPQETSPEVSTELPLDESLIAIPPVSTAEPPPVTNLSLPGHPPVFNPNTNQQQPPGPEYSPRRKSRGEFKTVFSEEMRRPISPVSNPQMRYPQPRYYRPMMHTMYQRFIPPAYMFKLLKDRLKGLIMGCTDETKEECLSDLVFGLPGKHWDYIESVPPETTVYLFNYSRRCLYGIFKSVGSGVWAMKPYGWSPDGRIPTKFPAQIKVELLDNYPCLCEEEYGPILDWKQNYINTQKFSFELEKEQVEALNELFEATKATDPDRDEPPIIMREKSYAPPHFRYHDAGMRYSYRGRGRGSRYLNPAKPGRGRGPPPSGITHPIAKRPVAHPAGNPTPPALPMNPGPPGIVRSTVVQPPPGMGPPGITTSVRTTPKEESLI